MPQYPMTPETVFTTPYSAEERISTFLRSVYGWMCAGLAITALVAFFVASTPGLAYTLVRTPFLMMGLVIAQLGLVFALSLRVQKMSSGTASGSTPSTSYHVMTLVIGHRSGSAQILRP